MGDLEIGDPGRSVQQAVGEVKGKDIGFVIHQHPQMVVRTARVIFLVRFYATNFHAQFMVGLQIGARGRCVHIVVGEV